MTNSLNEISIIKITNEIFSAYFPYYPDVPQTHTPELQTSPALVLQLLEQLWLNVIKGVVVVVVVVLVVVVVVVVVVDVVVVVVVVGFAVDVVVV